MPDGRRPEPGGWNRIHFVVEAIASEVQWLKGTDVNFRNEILTGLGSQQLRLRAPPETQSSSPIQRHHASPDSGGTVLTHEAGTTITIAISPTPCQHWVAGDGSLAVAWHQRQ
jgi:hypothetical protein